MSICTLSKTLSKQLSEWFKSGPNSKNIRRLELLTNLEKVFTGSRSTVVQTETQGVGTKQFRKSLKNLVEENDEGVEIPFTRIGVDAVGAGRRGCRQ